jgi:hypothetical protein
VYIGNLSQKAGLDEIKERIGLLMKEYVLCDPSTAEDNGLYWIERKPGANFCVMCTRDKSLAQRIVNYCKGRRCELHGKQLRVGICVYVHTHAHTHTHKHTHTHAQIYKSIH